jgi:hypothetical protein
MIANLRGELGASFMAILENDILVDENDGTIFQNDLRWAWIMDWSHLTGP